MKLQLIGHDERYVVEQSLMALFPGELPEYAPIAPEDTDWAVITLEQTAERGHVRVELTCRGKTARTCVAFTPAGTDFDREGQRRHAIGRCFFLAAREVLGSAPPWGMLTGVRPDKPVTWALAAGKTALQALQMMEEEYFVSPDRAALAVETGGVALRAARDLGKQDIAVYVGIPFCPTRCAYCSFVSQSVERSFALVPPYVDALVEEIRSGGKMVRETGLRVRSFYMGGGTPTTLSAEQMDRVLTAFEEAFDRSHCDEITVEAGRPDTITAEKLAVLKAHGVIDEHGAYVAPVFSTPELPPQLGEYLFQRLSPAFRFKVDPALLPPTFALSRTAGDTVEMQPYGFMLGQGADIVTVTLLAQTDWNDDGLNEWLLLCRVKPIIGKNNMRDYYLLVEKPGASILVPKLLAVYDCLSQSCKLFVDVDQKKPPYAPEEPTIEVKIGQKDVTLSPNAPPPPGAPQHEFKESKLGE